MPGVYVKPLVEEQGGRIQKETDRYAGRQRDGKRFEVGLACAQFAEWVFSKPACPHSVFLEFAAARTVCLNTSAHVLLRHVRIYAVRLAQLKWGVVAYVIAAVELICLAVFSSTLCFLCMRVGGIVFVIFCFSYDCWFHSRAVTLSEKHKKNLRLQISSPTFPHWRMPVKRKSYRSLPHLCSASHYRSHCVPKCGCFQCKITGLFSLLSTLLLNWNNGPPLSYSQSSRGGRKGSLGGKTCSSHYCWDNEASNRVWISHVVKDQMTCFSTDKIS